MKNGLLSGGLNSGPLGLESSALPLDHELPLFFDCDFFYCGSSGVGQVTSDKERAPLVGLQVILSLHARTGLAQKF